MVRQLALSALLTGSIAHAADFKVAYIDVQRALQETEDGKAAYARLKNLEESKAKAQQKDEEAFMVEAQNFAKQRETMDPKVRAQQEQTLQLKQQKILEAREKLRKELFDAQNSEISTITTKLSEVVAQIAQREGLNLVLTKEGLAWAPSSLDLTNELIRLYNAQPKSGGGKPAGKSDAPRK